MTSSTSPATGPGRLHVLDVLRGIALLGMFLVHFEMFASGGAAADRVYQSVASLFLEERFWAMFGMLFGVGFAVQLRRAESRGRSFVPRYLRRLAALAVFGFAAHAFFGFNVLLGYAAWGLPLLLVRRWSVRKLVIAAVISATSWMGYAAVRQAYGAATRGREAVSAETDSTIARNQAFRRANEEAQSSTSYVAVLKARLEHMRWFYAQPWSFLPVNTFTLFLLGFIAFRLGLFDEPERHRRLIATLMIFGAASWAVATWVTPLFGLIRTMWLTFTYMGAVLLLVAQNPQWLRRLAAFAWTGRMALTNYFIQIAILDLTFAEYALGLSVTPLVGLAMALGLFAANALWSRWWLTRHPFGPLEWLWRSITYARWQPWRVRSVEPAMEEGLAVIG